MEKTAKYITPTYTRIPLTLVQGDGYTLFDEEGKSYIDFTSGIGVNSLGYNHPKWVQATQQQLSTLQHISNVYYTNPSADLAGKLIMRTGFEHVFFVNSGAESNELAIKVARKWGHEKASSKHKILTLKNSFHGRTITTLAATGQDAFHQYFNPFTEGFDYIEANNIADLHEKVDEDVAAIMIEVIQGEGGIVPLDEAFLQEIESLTSKKEILLIIDEVQTGIGRTGKLFSYEHFGLTPDIVTSAKGLGSGLPIGAVLFGEKVKDVLKAGDHGTTYGGNPVATAGASVVLDTLDEVFLNKIAAKGTLLKEKLLEMDEVKSVDGVGLMLGIQFKEKTAKEVLNQAIEEGVLFLMAKDKLRLLPPLIIDEAAIIKVVEVLHTILQKETEGAMK
jgi:acetylornithine/N-succinyldiaminopimelate aminotransferase